MTESNVTGKQNGYPVLGFHILISNCHLNQPIKGVRDCILNIFILQTVYMYV